VFTKSKLGVIEAQDISLRNKYNGKEKFCVTTHKQKRLISFINFAHFYQNLIIFKNFKGKNAFNRKF